MDWISYNINIVNIYIIYTHGKTYNIINLYKNIICIGVT